MELWTDKILQKHWRGRSRDRDLITVYAPGDTYFCWDSGIMWEIREQAGGWKPAFRTIPLPVRIDGDTMEPDVG